MSEPEGQSLGGSWVDDPAAFAELVWQHGAAVHAYLNRRAGRQEADDLLGEVWLRAFAGRDTYEPTRADVRPWLYGIARHVLLKHWRAQGRPQPLPPALAVDPWADRTVASTRRASGQGCARPSLNSPRPSARCCC